MINLENVKKAVELQKDMNNDIDLFGETTYEKCKQLDRLIDNFNPAEDALFIELMTSEDEGPEFDSAGFSVADRMEDWDDYIACTDQDNQRYEDSHHCDDLDCNCSI